SYFSPMEIFIVALVALLASVLTFFSGFGLGTILLPAFALFFPIETAILLTAIVHFLNNIFKVLLVGKSINYKVGLQFGLPAIIGGFIGAQVLMNLPEGNQINFSFLGNHLTTNVLNIVIGLVIIGFSTYELLPSLRNKTFNH